MDELVKELKLQNDELISDLVNANKKIKELEMKKNEKNLEKDKIEKDN